jgi:hypothetical protein
MSIMTWGSNYHPELFAAGVTTLPKELAAAELALGHATTQRNRTYAIAEQAQVFAADAIENWVKMQDLLAEFRCTRESLINPIEMAEVNAAIKMMEITAPRMVQVALNQGNIAFWVQVCAEDARDEFYFTTNSLPLPT